jgi:hypothetical protein
VLDSFLVIFSNLPVNANNNINRHINEIRFAFVKGKGTVSQHSMEKLCLNLENLAKEKVSGQVLWYEGKMVNGRNCTREFKGFQQNLCNTPTDEICPGI